MVKMNRVQSRLEIRFRSFERRVMSMTTRRTMAEIMVLMRGSSEREKAVTMVERIPIAPNSG